ncbi:MAG: THUMP domain-containing protein [Candidatus Methanosuratincola petrocarbonis]
MEGVVVVRVGGEIGIKSKPVRRDYEQKLLRHLKERLREKGVSYSEIWRVAGRIYIKTGEPAVASRLASKVFGISSVSPGQMTTSKLDDIGEVAVSMSEKFAPGSFAVRCRRVGSHPYTSQEAAARIGEAILTARQDLHVDLNFPNNEIFIEIRNDSSVLYTEVVRGPDGFPLGTQDPVVGVIDETFESVAASWCLMKRGSPVLAAVFATGGAINEQTENNLAVLSEWSTGAPLKAAVFPCEAPAPLLQLMLASYYCKTKGLAAVVSGMPVPSLKFLSELNAKIEHSSVLFPLAALESGIIEDWAGMMGIDLQSKSKYPKNIDFGGEPEPSVVEKIAKKSFEAQVREDGSILPL